MKGYFFWIVGLLFIAGQIDRVFCEDFAPKIIAYEENWQSLNVGEYLGYIRDVDRQYQLQQVANGELDHKFVGYNHPFPHFGFIKGNLWLMFVIKNPSDTDLKWYLDLENAALEHVEFFYNDPKQGLVRVTTGNRYPFFQRPIINNSYVFPLEISAKSQQNFYLLIVTSEPAAIPLSLRSPKNFTEHTQLMRLLIGINLGFLVSMALYNFFLFANLKDSAYFYCFAFIMTLLFYQMANYGVLYQFWPNQTAFNVRIRDVSASLAHLSMMLLTLKFLSVKKYFPKTYLLVISIIALLLIPLITTVIYGPNSSIIILQLIVFLEIITVIYLSISSLSGGYKPARYFLAAFFVLGISVLPLPLVNLGLMEFNLFSQWSIQIGACLEVILLSFALADRISLIQQEKFAAEKSAAEAKSLAKSKTDFLAKMSHEIRTPMNGVIGMLDLLWMTHLQPLQKQYVEVIRNSGQNLLAIINEILDHAKIESGKMKLESVPFDLAVLIQDCISVFEVNARDKHLNLSYKIAPEVPKTVVGDALRLRQILLNLLSNSLKFTSRGAIFLKVKLMSQTTTKVKLRFSVKDTGIGISENNIKNLFQPFAQVTNGDEKIYGGTGLGLSISQQLVRLMKGKMGVKSQMGVGSTFWFTAIFGVADREGRILDEAKNKLPDSQPAVLKNLRVLVAEDNQVNQMVIGGLLKKLGIDATIVANGQEAVSLIQEQHDRFDVILMDCEMVVMDGYLATKKIRTFEQTNQRKPLYIIALTAHVLPEYRDKCYEAGMNDYVAKPIEYKKLETVLMKFHN